mmetsp:Transcript_3991/g.9069  ORF Transcript_3991/g.9069 Transcript_3991/m.9069 type:complete len:312 (+) Transcript_3991:89-1024(+)
MAPRQGEEDTTSMVEHSSLLEASSPLILTTRYQRSFSFEDIDMQKQTANDASAVDGQDHSLESSLKQLTEIGSKALNEVNGAISGDYRSPTVRACRTSLASDFSSMVDEAKDLVTNQHDSAVATSWGVSLAPLRADSYLRTILAALHSPERLKMDEALQRLVGSVLASKTNNDESKTEDVTLRISSWRTPSLVFDLQLGAPVLYTHEAAPPSKGQFDYQLPLFVEVRAIAEVPSEDIKSGGVGRYEVCTIQVEKCRHEAVSYKSTHNGAVGLATISVGLKPLTKKEGTRLQEDEMSFDAQVPVIRVEEARV